MDINWINWFGYLASLVILISLLTSSILKLRWINLFGALMFAVYGLLINSLPTAVMNMGIAIIDLYYLVKIYSSKEYFQLLELTPGSSYFKGFIDFYKADLAQFFGEDRYTIFPDTVGFYVLRNMVPAGLFIAQPLSEERLKIQLDFATPEYRDFKIGHYIYTKHASYFKSRGYNVLEASAINAVHEKYLLKMGFVKEGEVFLKWL